jgi:hypothetical protein
LSQSSGQNRMFTSHTSRQIATHRELPPKLSFVAKLSEYRVVCITRWSRVAFDASSIDADFSLLFADRHFERKHSKGKLVLLWGLLLLRQIYQGKLEIRAWESGKGKCLNRSLLLEGSNDMPYRCCRQALWEVSCQRGTRSVAANSKWQ